MRSSPTAWLAFVAILIVGLATGCGSSKSSSSSSSSSTSTPAITKAAFLKKGNAICHKGNRQIGRAANKLFARKHARPSKAELTKFATGTLIPLTQNDINQIRALGAPPGGKAKVNAILSSAQSALDKGKKKPLLLTSNGPGPFKKANQLSKSYGLKACAAG